MTRTYSPLAIVALLGITAVACRRPAPSPATDTAAASPAQNPPVTSPDSTGGLLGTEWRLELLAGSKALANVEATLTFPQVGRVAGNGSCNRFAGPVTIRADSISFGALAMTRMACANAINAQEARYAKALSEAERFEISANSLTIYSKGSRQPMVFIRTKPS